MAANADGTQLAAVVANGPVYLSNNGGTTWTARETSRNWRATASSANGNRLAAAVTNGQILTSDGGPPPPLVFTPDAGGTGIPYAAFTFQVEDDGPAGSNLDPVPNTFSLNVTAQPLTPFQAWAVENGLSTDPMADGGKNLLNFSFAVSADGTRPGALFVENGVITARGYPSLGLPGTGNGTDFKAIFGRRKNAGITSLVQFSADLLTWETSPSAPQVIADDGLIEACSTDFPDLLTTGTRPRFFRLVLTLP